MFTNEDVEKVIASVLRLREAHYIDALLCSEQIEVIEEMLRVLDFSKFNCYMISFLFLQTLRHLNQDMYDDVIARARVHLEKEISSERLEQYIIRWGKIRSDYE